MVYLLQYFLQVVVRDSCSGDPIVVASLSDGNYFGEISLLRLDGGTNRYGKYKLKMIRPCN